MRIQKIIPLLISINVLWLTACSPVAGNVIPEGRLTMESIYDDWGDFPADLHSSAPVFPDKAASAVKTGGVVRSKEHGLRVSTELPTFSTLENPALKLYVLPHLAGSEMLPIPGYWTAFSAYSRNYYALPLAAVQPENRK